jgi:acetyl-CoA synthetase
LPVRQDSYPIPDEFRKHAHITEQRYREMYRRSVEDPENFWTEQATTFIQWAGIWKRVFDWDFTTGHVRWFEGGWLNVCSNCADRHLTTGGGQTATIWEGNEPDRTARSPIANCTNRFPALANVLKDRGIGKGDRV